MPPAVPLSKPVFTKKSERMALQSTKIVNPPSYVEHGDCRFLIMDAPTDENLANYVQAMKTKKVKNVVRACEPSYSADPLASYGMNIVEMSFADGAPPSDDIISRWLELCEDERNSNGCVAVHCVAGLGRAPVLVGIALMELTAITAFDAIDIIRKARRGALNQRQVKYLCDYKVKNKQGCCTIM